MTGLADGYFEDLCRNLGFSLVAVDHALRIRFWNDQAGSQFGGTAEEMSGRSFLDFVGENQRAEVERLLTLTMEQGTAGETEVKYEEPGHRRTFVLIASPITDSAGECVGASACMRDISGRKRLSRELARSRRMASLGAMAGGVAHNFNNILGGMLTSIDYVLPSDSPRELRRTLRLLAQAIGRATRITQQLEAFAECEHEKIEMAELNVLMDRFLERIKPQAEETGIRIAADVAEVESRPYEAQRLMPILESLAQNAFDAMSTEGTLTVRMERGDDEAVITIADTGCGIPEDVLDRVFEPFFTTKGQLGGGEGDNPGLGLAAVHGLVAELGGKIQLESAVGVGTTVEVRLPLHREPPGGAISGEQGSRSSRPGGY